MATTFKIMFPEGARVELKNESCNDLSTYESFYILSVVDGVEVEVEAVALASGVTVGTSYSEWQYNEWYDGGQLTDAQKGYLYITLSDGQESKLNIRYYGVSSRYCGDSGDYNSEPKSIAVDRGGLDARSGGGSGTVASDLGSSAMYFASLGDETEINTDSGLIRNGTFNLKWNNFEGTAEWNSGTKGRYNSIEDGEVPGTITVIKENVYDNITTAAYNTFYDLNTGQSQTSPTITQYDWPTGEIEFSVEYGSVEATAIQDKYKRYDGSWNDAVDGMIDGMVQAAIDGSYQSKAVLNFKKTKVKDFKEETITAFPDQIMVGTTEDPSDEEIMETDGIMTDAITPTVASTVAGGEMGNY